MEYEFSKDDYGPYSLSIKTDAFRLDHEGYIELSDSCGIWVFQITQKGRAVIEKIIEKIPQINITRFDEILNKFKGYSFTKSKNHVYSRQVKEDLENNQLKKQILMDIDDLISILRGRESSPNSMFIRVPWTVPCYLKRRI